MIRYSLQDMASVVGGTLLGPDAEITSFAFDSRLVTETQGVLFVALSAGKGREGTRFVPEMEGRGVRAFLLPNTYEGAPENGGSFLKVDNPLKALQQLATWHRDHYQGCVAAITGSNGKTVVKEWIAQLWTEQEPLFRSPKSYNSQLGVSLALLMMDQEPLAVIEAGISQPGEMERLEAMIRPEITVFTGIGEAHRENFSDAEQLLREKLILARKSRILIAPGDDADLCRKMRELCPNSRLFTWGEKEGCDIQVTARNICGGHNHIEFIHEGKTFHIDLPFTDEAAYRNVLSAVAFYAAAGKPLEPVTAAARQLQAVAMRLEIRKGLKGSCIINDVYNSDLASLQIALNHLSGLLPKGRRIVILSDIYQSGYDDDTLYTRVAELIKAGKVNLFIGVGPALQRHAPLFEGMEAQFFSSTDDFIAQAGTYDFAESAVLLKGCRSFRFERITRFLEPQLHTTTLEVDLGAMAHNLAYYRSKLAPGVRCMAMVKALGYGSGDVEVAAELQRQHIDFLAVAYTDEGVTLRQGGIRTPIVVLNSEPESFASMIEYDLEPEIYDFDSLEGFISETLRYSVTKYPIHIKLDTGMHRLGFAEEELPELIRRLNATSAVAVRTTFSHFTSSDEPSHDRYTLQQIERFSRMSRTLTDGIGYPVIRHLCNSAGIERFPQAQFDMVRLGIGLYGISPIGKEGLKPVSTLSSTVVQIHHHKAGETVGYMRRGVLTRDSDIATLPIGYADGLRRALSCGNWSVRVNGQFAPIIGNICMDACMIDVTGIEVQVGDKAVIFGDRPSVEQMAEKLGTIPYEVLTDVAPRVKRIYIKEG